MYKIIEKSLITGSNLYALQRMFYPYRSNLVTQRDQVELFICQEDLIIANVSGKIPNLLEFNSTLGGYVKKFEYLCAPHSESSCLGYYDKFIVYSKDNNHRLEYYLQEIGDIIPILDITFYSTLVILSGVHVQNLSGYINFDYYSEDKTDDYRNISLFISDILPGSFFKNNGAEFTDILSSLLSWVSLIHFTFNKARLE